MNKHPRSALAVDRWTPQTRLHVLAKSSLLETLEGVKLVVYIRLLAATLEQRSRRVEIMNGQLWREPRSAVRALRELEDIGLIKIHYQDGSRLGRSIEVCR